MPRLKPDNANPVVGTFKCETCGQEASVLQIQKSRRRGMLYVRCGCGCDQRSGAAIQKHWREKMTARPGYEYAKRGEAPPVKEPDKSQDWRPDEPKPTGSGSVQETDGETVSEPKGEPNKVQDDDRRAKLRRALGAVY